MNNREIPGYTYGKQVATKSPISLEDLELLKESVLFTQDDERYLRVAGQVLSDQIEKVLDIWYEFMGSHSHLAYFFGGANDQPDKSYMTRVRNRFGQWILDTCNRPYDQDWLIYQHEIGLRHHRTKKNQTDEVQSVPNISFRYLVAFIYPITATIKPFLAKKGHSVEQVEMMHQAWFKSLVLQVALWSYPYVKEGDF